MSPNHVLPPFVEEVASGPPTIFAVETARVLFIGWSRRGPTNKALLVQSWAEYAAKFGNFDPKSDLAYAVHHFFANGGSRAHVIRLKATTRRGVIGPADPAFQSAVLTQFDPAGLAAKLDFFSLLCVPGLSDHATLAALMPKVAARRAFLVADCPPSATAADVVGTAPQGPGRENAAIYFPWVTAIDPLSGAKRDFPPSGFLCGIYARTDSSRGVQKAPAGTEARLYGASGLCRAITDTQNGPLNAMGINCLRQFMADTPVAWGARTLAGRDDLASDWKYVPVRRLALFIEESVIRGTQWAIFEPNEEPLWARLRLAVGAFLHGLFKQGAFQGRTPRDSYFAKCDRATNSASDIAAGKVNILVGFAPLRPAEFVTLRIEQRAGPPEG